MCLFYQIQGGEELENAHGMIQSLREDKQALIASVESKESANVDLRQAVRDLERDVRNMKTELEKSSKNERIAKLRVEELKRKCDTFYEQVSGLISQIQESELETSSLRQEISWLRQEVIRLRDEIDILLVTRESLPFL
jgi:chromosome segregation ATPase